MKTFLFILMLSAAAAVAKINVVATTADLGAIASAVGGDRIELTVLARSTEDPHFVDAKPSFYVKLNKADVLIEGGAELEAGWLPPLLEGARNSKLAAGKPGRVSCIEGISLLEIPSTLDRSKGDIHAAGNPHYTTDPLNAKIAADHMAGAFCAVDGKSCEFYRANLKKFDDQIDARLPEWQKRLQPFAGKRVVTYHNSWPYFARRFGLKMDLFLEPKPGIPPTPSHLAEVITQMKADGNHVILVEPHLNRKTAEAVASRAQAVVIDVAAYPGGSKGGSDYLAWMDSLVNALAKGLTEKN